MPSEINMPQLSDTMTEGTVVKWLKKEGDKIAAGEIVAEVETDKATMEMESFEAGTMAVLLAGEGEKIAIGKPIAVLATGKEAADEVKKKYSGGAAMKSVASSSSTTASSSSTATSSTKPVPEFDEREEERSRGHHKVVANGGIANGSSSSSATAVATNGRGSSDDAGRVRISPLAKRVAADRGVDVASLQGSGPNGRIVQADVLAAADVPAKAPATTASGKPVRTPPVAAPAPTRIASGQKDVVQLTKIRQTIAIRLQQSKQNLPHFYTMVDIDVEDISALRVRMNDAMKNEGVRLSLGDFVAKAVAVALTRHPIMNATFTNNEITKHGDVHLGMAVALPDGLIVPVLKNINQMGLKEIRQRSAELVDKARAQKLKGDEMTGATFTVSNLGTFGVREFSAIINPPEVGILAIAAAEKRPVVKNGQIVARTMMTVTLSADHRVIDGATAAEFLRTLKGLLEEPAMMLA